MKRSRPITELIDDLIASPKELIGEIQRNNPNRDGQERLQWPVLVNGESADCYVAFTLYPNEIELRFTICLVFRSINIWRLDFVPNQQVEINPSSLGHPFSGKLVQGPHWHRWTENRHMVRSNVASITLPIRSPYARTENGQNVWENAVRAFLAETGIAQLESSRMPQWPKRSALL